MAQPSIASYFNIRKRAAPEDLKISNARKVLVVDKADVIPEESELSLSYNGKNLEMNSTECEYQGFTSKKDTNSLKVISVSNVDKRKSSSVTKKVSVIKQKIRTNSKEISNQRGIHDFLNNITKTEASPKSLQETVCTVEINTFDLEKTHRTPPCTPTKTVNAMDKVNLTCEEPSLKEIKMKLSRSSRLAELKASISRFKTHQKNLEEAESKTQKTVNSPSLRNFKTIELELSPSPQKSHSPDKSYLSPRKDSSVRKNLLNLLSPTKNAIALPSSPKKLQNENKAKAALTLPFKYRCLAEIFRSIDTVCQILYNRKEMITFKKLKPAVEEMLKRNINEKQLSQIKYLFPDAFNFRREKLKLFGAGSRQEHWELIVEPNIDLESMTSELLLTRRRIFFNILIDKVKHYHSEFLLTLDPPLHIPFHELKRWHPEFDIERVPDIECASLPLTPTEEKITTGREVLEKARTMFSCNARMEQALKRLKQAKNNPQAKEEPSKVVTSILKGIPPALLEKVRQKQAAKALESMTRSTVKDKEIQLYSRLPEIARLTRNLFVAEKKSVLYVDIVVDKLINSFNTYLTKTDMEDHLRVISREVPNWLVFHEIRHSTFIKLSKNADLSLIIHKLESVAKEKLNA